MPIKANIDNAKVNMMRKHQVFVDGYPMPLVSTLGDDLVSAQEQLEVFGFEQQIYWSLLDGAQLRMEVVNDTAMQALYDVATGQVPYASGSRTYFPSETIRLNVLRNMMNDKSDGYEAVDFWDNWAAVIRTPSGGPRDRGTIMLDGRCKTPIRVIAPVGKKIVGIFDVVDLAATAGGSTGQCNKTLVAGSATGTLVKIPKIKRYRNADTYALGVELHCCDSRNAHGVPNFQIRFPVLDANVVDANGKVTLTDTQLQPYGLTATGVPSAGNTSIVTHAFVTYILLPPTGATDGTQGGRCLLSDPIDYAARYDA